MADLQAVETVTLPAIVEPQESLVSRLLPELPEYLEHSFRNLKNDTNFGTRNLTKEEKATFCRVYASGGNIRSACEKAGFSIPTLYNHLERDPDFQASLSLAKLSMCDNVQSVSYRQALTPKGTFDRGLQLRRFLPSVYRNSDTQVNVGVAVNFRPWRRSPR